LLITNHSLSSLKNVTAFIIIHFNKANIKKLEEIPTYTTDTSNHPLTLSWAKVIDEGHKPNLDINQGESADLNLFLNHESYKPLRLLQIASESGFGYKNRKGRVLLALDKSYKFTILLTADNMLPKRRNYLYDHATNSIVKK
jgi:hypothetical protein